MTQPNHSQTHRALAYLPALLLGSFALWLGSLPGRLSPWSLGAGLLLLAALALWPGSLPVPGWWKRPEMVVPLLALLLPPFFINAPGGWMERGVEVVVTLALGVVIPLRVAACWGADEARRRGVLAVAAVLATVSSWGLGYALLEGGQPAMPLGHRSLLAAWCVIVLPLAALGLRERGWRRVFALGALGLGLASVLASRSLGGAMGLGAAFAAGACFLPSRRLRWAGLGLGFVVLLLQFPRLAGLVAGQDSSLAARQVYWRAGWQGFLERPLLGWGPGSVPATLGRFLEPVPGVNPPSEVVGQLHNLPLEWLCERGVVGFLAAVGLLAGIGWHLFRRREGGDRGVWAAGLAALAGGWVAALTDSWSGALALPVAMAVAAGLVLAGRGDRAATWEPGPRLRGVGGAVFLAFALLAGLRDAGGRWFYAQATRATTPEAICRDLSMALRFEPNEALYLARRGACGEGDAELARRGAELAPGISAFQVSAGREAARRGEPFEEWLRRGLATDPLGAAAPYFLMALHPEAADAATCGARALLAEPRLFAATFFEQHPELVAAIRREILRWPGVDAGLKVALAETLEQPLAAQGPTGSFGLGFDDPQGGLSAYAFHHPAWPWEWFALPVRIERFESLRLPAATTLPSSSVEAFPKASCGPEDGRPQRASATRPDP